MSKKKNIDATPAAATAVKPEKAAKATKSKTVTSPAPAGKTRAAQTAKVAEAAPVAASVSAASEEPKKVSKGKKAPVAEAVATKPKVKSAAASNPAATEAKETSTELVAPTPITHDEIARLAYSYAEARGFVGGSPEDDWCRAENELRSIRGW